MSELRDSAISILMLFVLFTIQWFSVLTFRTYQLIKNAWATRLVADCELWEVLPLSQPTRTLVLACPGVDAIRFWPLPVQQPWEEDGGEENVIRITSVSESLN
jgi:hypothetical protein